MEVRTRKINVRFIFFISIMYMLTFQELIQNYIPVFKYFDEILSLLVFPVLIIKLTSTKSFKIKKNNLILIILLILITSIGWFSNIWFRYQPMRIALSDTLLCLKFFMAYFFSRMVLSEEFIKNNKSKIFTHVKLIIYLLFISTILNYRFKIWPSRNVRFGIGSNRLFYGYQTNLAAVSIFLLSLLELTRENKKEEIFSIICICIVLISTLRLKAIGAACLAIILIIYVHKTKKRITISKMAVLGVIAIIIAFDQISFYFLEIDQSARNQLLLKSIQIMKDYFPIGTGFATFGSYFSAVSYSPVYYKYKLSNIQGLEPNSHGFVSDTFWPIIFGQFGILGTICYIWCVILIFKNIQNSFSKNNINLYLAKMICFVYLIISSTSESAFMHTIAIPLALIIGIRASTKNKIKK